MSATDRALEHAAKAAGKTSAEWDFDWLQAQGAELARDMLWDPRRDSGQALDAAVQLELTIDINSHGCVVTFWRLCAHDNETYLSRVDEVWLAHGGDKQAATRTAIFRALAEIGRHMP